MRRGILRKTYSSSTSSSDLDTQDTFDTTIYSGDMSIPSSPISQSHKNAKRVKFEFEDKVIVYWPKSSKFFDAPPCQQRARFDLHELDLEDLVRYKQYTDKKASDAAALLAAVAVEDLHEDKAFCYDCGGEGDDEDDEENGGAMLLREELLVARPSNPSPGASHCTLSGSDTDTGPTFPFVPLSRTIGEDIFAIPSGDETDDSRTSSILSFRGSVNSDSETSLETHGRGASHAEGTADNGYVAKPKNPLRFTGFNKPTLVSLSDSEEDTPAMPGPSSRSLQRSPKYRNGEALRKAASRMAQISFPGPSGMAMGSNNMPRASSSCPLMSMPPPTHIRRKGKYPTTLALNPGMPRPSHLPAMPMSAEPSRAPDAMTAAQSLEAEQERLRVLRYAPVREGKKAPWAKVTDQSKLGRLF
ncbi:hypothetical protein EIP91_001150 [Steccherinum ochraceum]|uniref:Uncharacterized protein n=1 Tax=Steccherinum ochraceum TaxID=92696 RepID=A0A4R0RIH1_9APHY|nr:hypothetical protein EIP91_001150 [Steccherinum ochraceum]